MSIKTNLYDYRIYFALSYDNQFVEILEPFKWNSINGRTPRDPDKFGFMSDFLEDKYGMIFSFNKDTDGKTGGGVILEEIHSNINKGPNYEIYFEFGIKRSETYEQVNKWRVNLNDYNKVDYGSGFGGVSTSIEKMPFQAKLKARETVPNSINGYSTLDGQLLTPISTWQVRLHSKTIELTSLASSASPQRSAEYNRPTGGFNNLIAQPDQMNLVTNELKDVFAMPFALVNQIGLSGSSPASVNIFQDFLCQYTVTNEGFLNVSVNASFDVWLWHNNRQFQPAGAEPRIQGRYKIMVQRLVSGVQTIVFDGFGSLFNIDSSSPGWTFGTPPSDVLPTVTGGDRANCNKVPIDWTMTGANNIPVEVGDNVYVFYLITPTTTLSDSTLCIQFDNYLGQVRYNQLTTTPATNALGFRIIDVLNQTMEFMTGQKNAVISPFFEKGGAGYNYLLLNGYSIRNFGGLAYNFKASWSLLFNSLQSIFALGAGVQKDDDLNEKYYIDYITQFFKSGVIETFTETLNWQDLGTNNLFNGAELGYNKFEGLNIKQNDEICTSAVYNFQKVKTQGNVFQKKSDMCAAGYIIEDQRRNQFLANPSQTLSYDNEIFIVATTDKAVFVDTNCSFGNAVSRMTVFKVLGMKAGDKFVISDGANAGTVFTVVSQLQGYPIIIPGFTPTLYQDVYNITPAPVDQSPTVTTLEIIPSSPDQIFAERSEPFKKCTNVIDPSTIYNGRITPKHILFNWRPFLGISLYFQDLTEPDYVSRIITASAKMNSNFVSQFLPTEPFKGNIGDLTVSEIQDETVQNYRAIGTDLYLPYKAKCEINCGYNQYTSIRKGLAGELKFEEGGPIKNRGGLILGDDKGKLWFCHVFDIRYNFVTQIGSLLINKVEEIIL